LHKTAHTLIWAHTGLRTLIVLTTYRVRSTTGIVYDF